MENWRKKYMLSNLLASLIQNIWIIFIDWIKHSMDLSRLQEHGMKLLLNFSLTVDSKEVWLIKTLFYLNHGKDLPLSKTRILSMATTLNSPFTNVKYHTFVEKLLLRTTFVAPWTTVSYPKAFTWSKTSLPAVQLVTL